MARELDVRPTKGRNSKAQPPRSLSDIVGPIDYEEEIIGQWNASVLLEAIVKKGMSYMPVDGDMVPCVGMADTINGAMPLFTLPREYTGSPGIPGRKTRDPQMNWNTAVLIALVALGYVDEGDDPKFIGEGGLPYTTDEIAIVEKDNVARIVGYFELTDEGNLMREEARQFAANLLVPSAEWELALRIARRELGDNARRSQRALRAIKILEDGLNVPQGTVALWRRTVAKGERDQAEKWLLNGENWDESPFEELQEASSRTNEEYVWEESW